MMRLNVEKIGVMFGAFKAVDSLDLEIESGRIVALVGPNGAGKSTVLNLISGYYRPSTGRVMLKDGETEQELTRKSIHDRARAGIGRTFQTPRMVPEMSVAENVGLGRAWHGELSAWAELFPSRAGRRRHEERVEAAMMELERFGLADQADAKPLDLSLGAQRIVELARASFAGSGLLLLDEPFAGLSIPERVKLGEELRTLVDGGVGILLVEHNLEMIRSLADHAVVIDWGKRIAAGTPEVALADPAVKEIYLGSGAGTGLDFGSHS